MTESVYGFSDQHIAQHIGQKVKRVRLRQNYTQQHLAEEAQISLSTVKKIENGEIGSFDALLRTLRILGLLDILNPLLEEETLSPNEYYKAVQAARKHERKRATGNAFRAHNQQKESEW